MQKKLTITIDENVYRNLYAVIGEGKISKFIEGLIKPHVSKDYLASAYKEQAMDSLREQEAEEWIEGLIDNELN